MGSTSRRWECGYTLRPEHPAHDDACRVSVCTGVEYSSMNQIQSSDLYMNLALVQIDL